MSAAIVQLIWRSADERDVWMDICPAHLPAEDAALFERIVAAFVRIGEHLGPHVVCWPESSCDLATKELVEIRTFDYAKYALSAEYVKTTPVTIAHRFMIIS